MSDFGFCSSSQKRKEKHGCRSPQGETGLLQCHRHHRYSFLTLKVLKDLCGVQPGPEARQAPVPNLFPAFVRDHVPVLLHNHQLGHGRDLVALLQLSERKKKDKNKRLRARRCLLQLVIQ